MRANTDKKRLIAVIITFLCLPLVVMAVLSVFAFALPAQYGETFLGELKYKAERLRDTDGKRIIVIGGSSVAFGQDSALIEKYLPEYSVVNFGLYGDLGTKLMLDLAEREIRRDDIVIVSPEQDGQTLSLFFSGSAAWQAFDGDFSLLRGVKNEDAGALVGAFPHFAGRKAGYCLTGSPEPSDIYRRASFEEHGDIKSGWRPYNIMPAGSDVTRKVSLSEAVVENDFVEYLNVFAKSLRSRGASVYYRLCPINAAAIEDGGDADAFYDYMYDALDFEFIGDPHNSVIAPEYFYDSNFHLNDSGVVVNTYNLIRDVKAVIGDSSPTDIAIPPPPEAPPVATEGDNGDESMFVYEDTEKGCRIVGLTGDGKTRKKLTVPALHDGKTVTGFTQNAFVGATELEELVLQENVGMIEDRSFEDCRSLEKVILLHSAPNKCIPGGDLFGSAKFGIYVPRKLLKSYRVSYFWAEYASRIYAAEVIA